MSKDTLSWYELHWSREIDVDRLQTDTTYARACLALAQGSTSATLRRSAERLAPCVPAVVRWHDSPDEQLCALVQKPVLQTKSPARSSGHAAASTGVQGSPSMA